MHDFSMISGFFGEPTWQHCVCVCVCVRACARVCHCVCVCAFA